MVKCYVIGKIILFGNKCSYVLNVSCCIWKVNLQIVCIKDENGNVKRVKILVKVLKKLELECV